MSDTVRANGTVVSDQPCPHEDCKRDVRHWHQHYDNHDAWGFGQGCPTHLHQYGPASPGPDLCEVT